MPEKNPGSPLEINPRTINAIKASASGLSYRRIAKEVGFTTTDGMSSALNIAYREMGVHDLLGATKRLLDWQEIDPQEIAKGHNLTAFNSLRPEHLDVVAKIAAAPPEKAFTMEDLEAIAKSSGIRTSPERALRDTIYRTVGARSRQQLVVLYEAFQKLRDEGLGRDQVELDFPKGENIEQRIIKTKRMDYFKLSPRDLLLLNLHIRGVFYSRTGIVNFLGNDQPDPDSEKGRVTKDFVTKQRMQTFDSIVKLYRHNLIDLDQFTDNRDLLRFRTVSDDQREDLEALIRSNYTRPDYPQRNNVLISNHTLREADYKDLRKAFGVATNEHLAILYYTYKCLHTSPQKVSEKRSEHNPPLIGNILSLEQAEIFKLTIQGLTAAEVAAKLKLTKSQYRSTVGKALASMGIDRKGRGDVESSLIQAVNKLISSGEIDVKTAIKGCDLTNFDRLEPSEISVLRQLTLGTNKITSSTDPERILTGVSLNQILQQIRKKTGLFTRMQLALHYKAYESLLAQGHQPDVSDTMPKLAIRVIKKYILGTSIDDAIKAEGRSYPSPSSLFKPIRDQRNVHTHHALIFNLISNGEISAEEIRGSYNLEKFDTLTARELGICNLIKEGLGPQEISQRWGLQIEYTRTAVSRLYKKLDVKNSGQLAALFHLYQHPTSLRSSAKEVNKPDSLNLVALQITRLRLKGKSDNQIAKQLNINTQDLNNYVDQLSVYLGTSSHIETAIELYRAGRIDVGELMKNYKIQDFASLDEFEIGALETLVTYDPRRYLSFLEKMAHYLQKPPEQVKEILNEIQLQIGRTAAYVPKTKDTPQNSPPSQPSEVRESDQENIVNDSESKPLSIRQQQFGEQVYQPYLDKVHGYVNSILKDPAQSQDVAQDVLLYAYNNIDSLPENPSDLFNVIIAMARTQSRKAQRISNETQSMDDLIFSKGDGSIPSSLSSIDTPEDTSIGEFEPMRIEELALLYMEYRRRLRSNPQSLLEAS